LSNLFLLLLWKLATWQWTGQTFTW